MKSFQEIQKVLTKLGKEKSCELIGRWKKACVRQFYWAVTSTKEHLGEVKLAKFHAFLSHVINKHKDLPNRIFNACVHGDIVTPRVWINKGMKNSFNTINYGEFYQCPYFLWSGNWFLWINQFCCLNLAQQKQSYSSYFAIAVKLKMRFSSTILTLFWFLVSEAYEKLYTALHKPTLVKAIKKASSIEQTSCLEGYHSVVNQFAPKMFAYSYLGMLCRWLT